MKLKTGVVIYIIYSAFLLIFLNEHNADYPGRIGMTSLIF